MSIDSSKVILVVASKNKKFTAAQCRSVSIPSPCRVFVQTVPVVCYLAHVCHPGEVLMGSTEVECRGFVSSMYASWPLNFLYEIKQLVVISTTSYMVSEVLFRIFICLSFEFFSLYFSTREIEKFVC